MKQSDINLMSKISSKRLISWEKKNIFSNNESIIDLKRTKNKMLWLINKFSLVIPQLSFSSMRLRHSSTYQKTGCGIIGGFFHI